MVPLYLLIEDDFVANASAYSKCCPSGRATFIWSPSDVSYDFGAGFIAGALL